MSDNNERGILTDRDIEFLKGERQFEGSTHRSHVKQAIRERVKKALHDIEVLCEYWDREQMKQTFDELDDSQGPDSDDVAATAIEFLYLALATQTRSPELFTSSDPATELLKFERAVCEGIKQGKSHFQEEPDAVSIDSTVSLQEYPETETLSDEVDSETVTEVWRRINEKYQGETVVNKDGSREELPDDAEFYDRDGVDIERVIDEIKMRWRIGVGRELSQRYRRSGSFRACTGEADFHPFSPSNK